MAKKTLCAKCAAILSESKDVKKTAGGVNNKVTCSSCGRRRFGGIYEVRRKETAKK